MIPDQEHVSLPETLSLPEKAAVVLLLALGAFLLLYNTGHYYFWADEGDTALFGRRVLTYGLPYGFDGRNLFEFRNGTLLNQDFLPTIRTPWLQYFVAALSMKLFGFHGFGGRALFLLIGFAAIVLHYRFITHYFSSKRLGLIYLVMLVTSVSMLLYIRQCRYYALVMLFPPLIGYLYLRFYGRYRELVLVSILFFLFFHANPLSAVTFIASLALILFFYADRQKTTFFFLWPSLVTSLLGGLFYGWLYQNAGATDQGFLRNINPVEFLRIFWLYAKDYNETQLLPVGVVMLLLFFWWRDGRPASTDLKTRRKKEASIFCIIIGTTLLLSVLSPQDSREEHADLRYAAAIFPLLILVQAFVIDHVFAWRKWVALVLAALLIFTNLFTLSPFRSYLAAFINENSHPYDNPVKVAVEFLAKRIQNGETMIVAQNDMLGTMQFYLGDRALFGNVIGRDNRNLLGPGVALPDHVYSEALVPAWIVFFGMKVYAPHTIRHLEQIDFRQYHVYTFPVWGQDTTRPELYWRTFTPVERYDKSEALFILKRK